LAKWRAWTAQGMTLPAHYTGIGDMINNGADVTVDADLTSDLDGSDIGAPAAVTNNGGAQQPAGTRIVGQDAAPAKPDAAAPTDAPAAPTVREALSAALKGQKEAAAAPAPAPAAAAPGERPRNLDGTFKSAEQIAAEQAAAPAGQQPAAQAPVTAVPPPARMSPVEAQAFASLPAELQHFVARTMEGVEQTALQSREYGNIIHGLEQRKQGLALEGMTPEQYIGNLTALSDFAGKDPEGFLAWFAQTRGIDPTTIGQGQPQLDPNVQRLMQEIDGLKQTVNGQTQQQQQAQHNATVQEIVTFGTENGADGQPLRPYFDELGDGFLPILAMVKQQNPNLSNRDLLSKAYEQACWANPDVRGKMQAATEAKRLADLRATAGRAQQAGTSLTGAPGGGAPAATEYGDGSVRSIIQSVLARG
jgi:hypothetical protein